MMVAVNATDAARTVRTPISLAGSVMTDLVEGRNVTLEPMVELEPYGYKIFVN